MDSSGFLGLFFINKKPPTKIEDLIFEW